MTIYDFVAQDPEDIDSSIRYSLLEEQRVIGERRYRRKDGSLVDVEVSLTVIPYRNREALCALARDITERKALEEQLKRKALHDELTDLPNRALFLDRLQHALARSGRLQEPVAVLFVDLDDFKIINDSLGHDTGNALLTAVAERLRDSVRPGDTVARLFGDEFAVLLEAPTGIDEAHLVTERIGQKLGEPVSILGREVFVSSSIGIALGDSPQDRPENVLRRADLAMYTAKSRGKNGYEVFDPSMNTRALERMDLEYDLRRAVEREEFEVYYQPIIELDTGKIAVLEALARWEHPERGTIDAAEFIRAAEETGLIRTIGQLTFEEASQQALRWRDLYPDHPLLVSVNFSTSQFSYQANAIPEVLDRIELDPRSMLLEFTERTVMDNPEFASDKLQRLKDMGVKLAIDDYGLGYSSLHYLKLMPLDYLKIGGSFIAGLGEDDGDAAIVSGTINLAHALRLKVIAEGVETPAQLARLKELRCDLAQGFYLAEPLPSEKIPPLLDGGLPWRF